MLSSYQPFINDLAKLNVVQLTIFYLRISYWFYFAFSFLPNECVRMFHEE